MRRTSGISARADEASAYCGGGVGVAAAANGSAATSPQGVGCLASAVSLRLTNSQIGPVPPSLAEPSPAIRQSVRVAGLSVPL